jgi:(p)ppGpp synthase/HD superfamily hydrolase
MHRSISSLAVRLFAGLYRPSGKTFLDHVVGTASIVHEMQGKPALTAAGLLHSAYSHGNFGFAGKISARSRSKRMVATVGEEVETYVKMYTELPWRMSTVSELQDRIDGMTQSEREVVSLRVANELEDYLNGGTLYCHSAARHKDKLEQNHELLSSLAARLGLPVLQHEIDRVFAECASQALMPELLPQACRPKSYLILPESCRKSAWLSVYGGMRRMLR